MLSAGNSSGAHTPGPWELNSNGNVVTTGLVSADEFDEVIAEVYTRPDANLIAAAPELLEALRPFAECAKGAPDKIEDERPLIPMGIMYPEGMLWPTVGDLRKTLDAIAKATGSAQSNREAHS